MARKSFARQRLDNIKKNKQRLKDALNKIPTIPGAPLPFRLLTAASDQFVDAASFAFNQELLLNRVVELEDNLMRSQMQINQPQISTPISKPSIIRELLASVPEVVDTSEGILKALSDEDMADTELIDAVLADLDTGRDVIRRSRQFDRQNLLPRFSEPIKRTRKKTKTDKNMSKALRLANERFRKKNGSLRKGATQSKIMKFAHKLLRKM